MQSTSARLISLNEDPKPTELSYTVGDTTACRSMVPPALARSGFVLSPVRRTHSHRMSHPAAQTHTFQTTLSKNAQKGLPCRPEQCRCALGSSVLAQCSPVKREREREKNRGIKEKAPGAQQRDQPGKECTQRKATRKRRGLAKEAGAAGAPKTLHETGPQRPD